MEREGYSFCLLSQERQTTDWINKHCLLSIASLSMKKLLKFFLTLVWCRLLCWLMQFNKLIKNQLHSCPINQYKSSSLYFWEGLQLYVSGYSCMFRLVLNFLKAIPYIWCKALNGTVHFTIKYGSILGKNGHPSWFSTNRDVSLLISLRKIAYHYRLCIVY
jgi:hypothetical protein